MPVPKNPDLPTSNQVPGVYTFLQRTGSPPVVNNRKVNIFAYKTSAGGAPANIPIRVNSESDMVTYAGTGSDAHLIYRSFISHLTGGLGAEVYVTPIVAPGGTAQTRLLTILKAPSAGALAAAGHAAAAGILSVWICGHRFDVNVANGDDVNDPTAAETAAGTDYLVARNLLIEINKKADYLPVTATRSTNTITLTSRHAAATSTDIPIMVTTSNTSMAIAVSCGTLTLANASDADTAQSTGHTLLCTTQTAQYAPGNAESANTAAAGFVTAINNANNSNTGTGFPLIAAQTAPAAVLTLFYTNDRVVNRLAATTLDTSQTLTLACGNVGATAPTLTTALTTIQSQDAFRLWITNFTDTTTLGTLITHLETQGNGVNQKGQELVYCSTLALATAGAIITGTTPAMTTTSRFFPAWCPASPQRECELAARVAAQIISQLDYPPHNYAGDLLKTNASVPLLMPHLATRPSDAECNSAMVTYYMTPLRDNGQGQLAIMSGRTSAKPSATMDFRYVWWGTQLADDYVRDDLAVSIPGVIKNKSIKAVGQPVTSNTITADGVKAAVFARMVFYESQDIFDGAESLKDALQAEINVTLPSRIDVKLPKRFPIPAEQVSIVAEFAG